MRTLLSVIATGLVLASPAAAQESTDPLEAAQRWLDVGSPEAALDVWEAAADSLFFAGVNDPRLGIAYIETATEFTLDRDYDTASRLYLQSFVGTDLDRYGEEVEEEVRRIQPLLSERDSAAWEALIQERNPQILVEIRRFWISKDPTPTTTENERLIEHWGRIAYVRRTYTQAQNSPYRTDDRGTIFVQFGPPGRRKAGNLGSDGSEMRRWVRDRTAREAMARLDPNPTYEVWVYDTLNPRELIYYLFGNESGSGPYRMVRGVRDLISSAALSPNSRRVTPGNIRAAHFMELFYYAELSAVGGDFSRRYADLEQIWGQAESRSISVGSSGFPSEGSLEALSLQYDQSDQQIMQDPFRRPYETEVSDLENVATVQLVATQTRVLSDENEARVVLTALSAPRARVSTADSIAGVDLDLRGVRHTLLVRDSTWTEVGQLVGNDVRFGEAGVSSFTLRHPEDPLLFTMVANEVGTERRSGEIIRFPGRVNLPALPPLSTNEDSLEMSDLVIGIEPHEGLDAELLPFPVVPGEVLWRDDEVLAYMEVYHLLLVDGVAQFRASFQVLPWDRVLNAPLPGVTPTTLSFDLESQERTSRQVLNLGIENMVPGEYQVEVTLTDLQRGTRRTRTQMIEIGSPRQRR
jgi:GWxTD domain-containing protein